jgi:hypothetical protein
LLIGWWVLCDDERTLIGGGMGRHHGLRQQQRRRDRRCCQQHNINSLHQTYPRSSANAFSRDRKIDWHQINPSRSSIKV